MLRKYSLSNPWRGVTAVALVAAGAAIAALYGIMAVLVLNKER